jgi:hypothetical protein
MTSGWKDRHWAPTYIWIVIKEDEYFMTYFPTLSVGLFPIRDL